MPLLNYAEVRPWAKAIKAAVLTRKMPPWFADPAYRQIENDPRLSAAEIATLVAWANNGAPEGDKRHAQIPPVFRTGWNIDPDLVIELPKPVVLPATGTINYKFILVRTNFPTDLWVSAAEMRAGDARVLHHAKVWVRPPGSRWMVKAVPGEPYENETQPEATGVNYIVDRNDVLGKYNPGLGAQRFDIDGAAKFVPKGSDLVFELHYTSAGRVASDRTKLGLVLAKKVPARRYYLSIDPSANHFTIPAGAGHFEVTSEVTVNAPARLVYVQPHMHLRGKDYELRVTYPSGASETVFKGTYDFHWQLGYTFAKPVDLPRGTRIVGIAHFDNSANNRFNPDATKEVHWGMQNSDEMSNAFVGLIFDVNVVPEKVLIPSGPSKAPGLLQRLLQ